MARLGDVVFDCRHAASLARFWAAAVDGYAVAPYDDEEIARLQSLGIAGPEDDPGVVVERLDSGVPRLYFQQVTEPRVAEKNRLHLDLRCDDLAAEVRRLVALGASVLASFERRKVLADPEGNEFCVEERP
ncbi:MAG TPA: VOC family protein [Acidimicrobiales bacterium]|nr:VOC family protein [Acidimicrobiales bacterium]